MNRRFLLVSTLALAACNPPAVDPNADFTIEGSLVDENGDPAADTTVYVYKEDSWFAADPGFLQELDDVPQDSIYTTQTDVDGNFVFNLKGVQVNTESGSGAAYLTVVYHAEGDTTSWMATATDWHTFSDTDPVWEAGTLKLWNGGSATEAIDDIIDFSWSDGPSGNSASNELPYFLFVYESGSPYLQWAEHTFDTEVAVPRVAFGNGDPAEFFLVGFSTDGSRQFQHRTDFKEVASWSQNGPVRTDWATASALLYDTVGELDADEAFNDNVVDKAVFIDGVERRDLYVDLGQARDFSEILLYNLGVYALENAEITVRASSDTGDLASVVFDTDLGSFLGDDGFQDWGYYAAYGFGTTRWLHIGVERVGNVGLDPYFTFIGEIKVLD